MSAVLSLSSNGKTIFAGSFGATVMSTEHGIGSGFIRKTSIGARCCRMRGAKWKVDSSSRNAVPWLGKQAGTEE
jgi:hypothetical protein